MRNLVLAFVIALFVGSAAKAALVEIILDHGYSDAAGNNFQVLVKVNPAAGERGVSGMGIRMINTVALPLELTVTMPVGGSGGSTTNRVAFNTNREISTITPNQLQITGTQPTSITAANVERRYIGLGITTVALTTGKDAELDLIDPVGFPMQVAVGKDTVRDRTVSATNVDAWRQWFITASTTTANSNVALITSGGTTSGKYTNLNNSDTATGVIYVVVPEPASLALMGLGGLVLAFRRR